MQIALSAGFGTWHRLPVLTLSVFQLDLQQPGLASRSNAASWNPERHHPGYERRSLYHSRTHRTIDLIPVAPPAQHYLLTRDTYRGRFRHQQRGHGLCSRHSATPCHQTRKMKRRGGGGKRRRSALVCGVRGANCRWMIYQVIR